MDKKANSPEFVIASFMSTLFVVMILALVVVGICNLILPKQDDQNLSQSPITRERNGIDIWSTEFEGHRFIIIDRGKNSGSSAGLMHHPDCSKCKAIDL